MRIERTLDPQQHAALRQALTQVPSTEFTVIGVQSPAVTWIGTRQGAIRLTRSYQAREYFAGLRWLPDDHVTGIGFDGAVTWIETARGFARIEDVPMTLAGKSRVFRRSHSGPAQPLGVDGLVATFASLAICPPTRWCRATTTVCGRRCTSWPSASASA